MWPTPLRHWLRRRRIKAKAQRYARDVIDLAELNADKELEKAAAIRARVNYGKELEKHVG